MSGSSESGSESELRGSKSSESHSSGSNSTSPSPSSCSSRQRRILNMSPEGNELKLKISKNNSLDSPHTPEGVLTPPNEGDALENPTDHEDPSASEKSNGRLKFYKDGFLCLELSHHKTKWVQIRKNSTFPQIVQVSKEAVIPCQFSQQPSFSSPNSNNAKSYSRVESSTSHSMSDDGSSMLSIASPRIRDSTWRKQSVPLRCTSSNFDFYMKPASCVVSLINFRQEIHLKAPSYTRRPYSMPDFVNIFRDRVASLESKCGLKASSGSSCLCDSSGVVLKKSSLVNGGSSHLRTYKKKDLPLQYIEKKLSELVDRRLLLKRQKENKLCLKRNGCNASASSPRTPVKPSSPKLSKKDARLRDLAMGFRPILAKDPTQSPQINLEKPILTVPSHRVGLIVKKQRDTDAGPDLSLSMPLNFSMSSKSKDTEPSGMDTTDGKIIGDSVRKSGAKTKTYSKDADRFRQRNSKSKISNSKNAKMSSSSTSILKSSINEPHTPSELKDGRSYLQYPLLETNSKCSMLYPSPPPSFLADKSHPDLDGYQKHTVSRVISYTINSLLGTDSNGTTSLSNKDINSRSPRYMDNPEQDSLARNDSPGISRATPPGHETQSMASASKRKANHVFNVGDQDQSSFLRHLLDTSDPIPSTPVTSSVPPSSKIPPIPPKKRSAINNHGSSSVSPSKSRRSPKSGSNHCSQPVNSDSSSIVIPKPTTPRSSQTPSFGSSGVQAQGQGSNAAVANAAYNHYTSLLPATFIPNLTGADSYFKSPEPGTSLHSIPLNYTGDTALNLSHRAGWSPFFLPPLPFSSFHDRASNGCQDLSMNRRNLSPYLPDNLASPSVDNDVPLNLCKRSKPN